MSQFNRPAEYTLYQANRFYRREPLTRTQFDAAEGAEAAATARTVNVPTVAGAPE